MVGMAMALWQQVVGLVARDRSAERGQGLVEYALIIALVAVVVVGALLLLGPTISSIFRGINTSL